MKRDLERWSDKLAPDEEHRLWSKMRDGIRKGKSRKTSWMPRLWMSRAAVAAAAVLAAAVIWQADLLTPDRVAEEDLAVDQMTMETEIVQGAAETQTAAETQGAAETEKTEEIAGSGAPGAGAEAPGAAAGAQAADGGALDAGSAKGVAAEGQGQAQEPPAAESRPSTQEPPVESQQSSRESAAEAVEKKEAPMPKTDYFEEEDASAVRRGVEAESRDAGAAKMKATENLAADEETIVQKDRVMQAEVQAATAASPAEERSSPRGFNEAPAMRMAEVGGAGEIRGQVTDIRGNPLHSASIVVIGTRFGAMADDSGFFRIRNIPAGTYSLMLTYIGYEDLVIPDVVVEKDRTNDLKALVMKPPLVGRADTIVVTAPEHKISPKSSETSASSPVGNILGAVEQERGVTARVNFLKKRYPSLTGGSVPVNDELADDMYFRHYGANPFIDAEEDALSTFALDVDTGSYTICRRYINEGHLPPPEAVRVEEFVNFFQKDLTPPRNDDFRIHIDGMPSPFAHVRDRSYYLLRIGIRGREIDDRDRKPAQIVLVIDTSGSMGMGNRLPLLKDSMKVLLDELRRDDEIGIVEFGSRARVVLPLTPLSEERDVYRAIESLHTNGSTNAEHGLKLGYKMMRKGARRGSIHRIIFCSDGVANVGNTGWESILESVRRESDEISLTTIGFGMGNYNDILMEQLADAGDGQYAYVDNMREAKRVLRENLTGTLQTIAKDTKAQIEFNPDYVLKYRLLGYENRDVRDEDFRNDDIDAGEIGAGHEVMVLYEVKLQPKLNRGRMATVYLRYEDPESGEVIEMEEPVSPRSLAREVDDAPANLVVDACVAEFAEILRGSYWAKESSFEDVLDLLDEAAERMTSRPEVDELMDLVERAIKLGDNGERPRRDYREE